MATSSHKLDVVGDIHGQLEGLRALGRHLGYRVDDGWSHPDGRTLVFLGDLTDRGPDSLGVARLVFSLVDSGRAFCLMGNHEYNLVGWALGQMKVKTSNRQTCDAALADQAAWKPLLERMRDLPLAVHLPELRLVHAVWLRDALEAVRPRLAPRMTTVSDGASTAAWLRRHVVLESPWGPTGLRPGITRDPFRGQQDSPQELLLKGYEIPCPPFKDRDGKTRDRARVTWWDLALPPVPTDELTVFGHYWNLPPMPARAHDAFAPPHPPGTDPLRAWQRANAASTPAFGTVAVPPEVRFVCVDYSGVPDGNAGSCVGAFRWPERQVSWVRLPDADVGLLGQGDD